MLSKNKYEYFKKLDKKGKIHEAFKVAKELADNHDQTLNTYMLIQIYQYISLVYFKGEVCEPNFDLAMKYVKLSMIDNQHYDAFIAYFMTGLAKKDFDETHMEYFGGEEDED